MERKTRRPREGVQERHSRRCDLHLDCACSCSPGYQAQVWSARDQKPIRKTFATLAEAVAWRQEAQVALRRGTLRAPYPATLAEAARDWLSGAEAAIIRTRSGDPYKPSALRTYRHALNSKVLPSLGHCRLSAITRHDLQDLVDKLVAAGYSASTVRNTVLPLRAIYRRASERDQIPINPTHKLRLPAVRGKRERTVRADEAASLLSELPNQDRALWATAFYAGLRRGELQALKWANIDLDANLINVSHAWDQHAGLIDPKSRAGERRVPITTALRRHLIAHRLEHGHRDDGFAFAKPDGRPFDGASVLARARKAWQMAGLQPITLHECRHTYAAFMIAAGVNVKALSSYMGHTSITVTLDRYGHLLPGNEREAANLLDTWLRQNGGVESRFEPLTLARKPPSS